jgi:cytoskeletal protein CcmA (bactofilin family)
MWRKSEDSKPKSSPGASLYPDPSAQHPGAAAVPSNSSSVPASINQGIKFKGEISGQGDLVFDGEFEGSITLADGTFTVGPNARVTAEIEAPEIVVRGEVIGSLKARERVHIWSTGKLTGNLDSRGIMIDDGAELHSKVAVPRAASQVAVPPAAAQKVPAPQAEAPKAPTREAAASAVPASEIAAPEVLPLPEAKPSEAPIENDQPPRAEIPPRAKRAAASTSPPTPKES